MSTFLLFAVIGAAAWYLFFRQSTREIPIKLVISTEYSRSPGENEYKPDPDHDNWEGAFWDVPSPRNISANLRIEYQDGAGSRTTRDIRLMKYGPWEGGAILWAYCNLRQANRTFRTDRIVSCTDLDTGEIIENLESWLDGKYQASPDRSLEKIIETAWDALRVLYYVSKADGRLTQKERAVVRDAVRSLSDHPAIDDKRIDDMFDAIDNPATITSFKQAFGRLVNENRALAEKVSEWAETMVATEKTIAATEQEALDYVKTRLAKAAVMPRTQENTNGNDQL